ncbi:hypothetical protein IWQ54_004910 [Labrenzia sp. EL_195]|nr:hypothetical protein [Labrenzia sp. EL_195]
MTDKTKMTDELIMAYADGQLPDAEAQEVEAAARTDAVIREKIDLYKETSHRLKAAAKDIPPVPDALAQRVSSLLEADTAERNLGASDNVVAFAPKKWIRQWPAALAASITLAIGLGTGIAIGPSGTSAGKPPFGIAALADPEISEALSNAESGSSIALGSGATLNLIASFVDADDELCREFDYEKATGPSIVSVACHSGGTWQPRIAIAANKEQSGDFAPASSLEALETWLLSSGLGEPLDIAGESRLLRELGMKP